MRFEHEHDDEDDASAEALAKEDLVADLGVSFSVERLRRELSNATPCCVHRWLHSIAEMKVDLGFQKSGRFPHLLDAIHPVLDRDP